MLVFCWLLSAGCTSFKRYALYERFPSRAMRGVWMETAVLAPPLLDTTPPPPLVVFLHGGGDGPDCFDRHGLSKEILKEWEKGTLPPFVVVIPDGDLGFWADWYDGSRRYESHVIDEVMVRVARRYRTAPCPEGCHLVGISMGAEGALRWAVRHKGKWASVVAISGPALDAKRRIEFLTDPLINIFIPTWHVFGPPDFRRAQEDDPWSKWRSNEDLGTSLFLFWGSRDRDFVREGSERFHLHLKSIGIQHTAEVFDGGHDWASWKPVLLRWIRMALGSPSSRTFPKAFDLRYP
ncbi:MAG: esterase family protein [Sandaracinaceae bacterium]|nr:esterase family protein [Sandaracinaceae bacterium]MDW8245624.1 alpha/beta fold hydrolase [Sandaracinaceae bacterium]